ncbi:DNA polymerase IV [Virgibacillus xinjiangensis]|uniref:DNA polymerase IV n=1 Tax=Virgibacillus xinjiangensis TaxID=393090 RepID=A0ABV7CRT8_9BACI
MEEERLKKGRVIFHIDMNCFYASVEMAFNPELKGKPLAIAGNPQERKGIVVTSSYEARAEGVKTTMPLWQARKLCPDLIVMRPNFERYRAASSQIFQMLAEVTPIVQPVSIDEGYMDVTNADWSGTPIGLAEKLQAKILKELGLPCSIGIAPNKFLAKMASDMKKPLGITILRKREVEKVLWPLPVAEMHGVGEKTAAKLKDVSVYTIGDLANKDAYALKQMLGINGVRLKDRANGIDQRPVDPEAVHEFKSIGSSQTLPHDTVDEREINKLLGILGDNVERRLKRKQAAGKSVQLMLRYHDRRTITRSRKLYEYVDGKEEIVQVAKELLDKHWDQEPIRLLGITLQDVEEKKKIAKQLDIFTYEQEAGKEKLYQAIDELKEKYGKDTFVENLPSSSEARLQPGTSLQKDFLDDFKVKKRE